MPRILIDEAPAVRCACVREGARRAQLTAPTEGVAMPSDAVGVCNLTNRNKGCSRVRAW